MLQIYFISSLAILFFILDLAYGYIWWGKINMFSQSIDFREATLVVCGSLYGRWTDGKREVRRQLHSNRWANEYEAWTTLGIKGKEKKGLSSETF